MVAALESLESSQPHCGRPEMRAGCERHSWHGHLYLRDNFLTSAVLVATTNRTAVLVSHLPGLERLEEAEVRFCGDLRSRVVRLTPTRPEADSNDLTLLHLDLTSDLTSDLAQLTPVCLPEVSPAESDLGRSVIVSSPGPLSSTPSLAATEACSSADRRTVLTLPGLSAGHGGHGGHGGPVCLSTGKTQPWQSGCGRLAAGLVSLSAPAAPPLPDWTNSHHLQY